MAWLCKHFELTLSFVYIVESTLIKYVVQYKKTI